MFICRQNLTFLEIKETRSAPYSAEYVHRGSVQYEFGNELLQTPIQLLRISNVEAQVLYKMIAQIFFLIHLEETNSRLRNILSWQVVEILNHLVTFNVAKVHEDAPLKFLELIQLLRVARLESIEAIWNQFKAKADHR